MTTRRWLIVACMLVALIGGGVVAWQWWPRQRSYITDARNIRRPAESVQVRDILWDAPQAEKEILALTGGVTDFTFDAERRILNFVHGDGTNADVFERRQYEGTWSAPTRVEALNSPHVERDVALSPDGNTLLFASDRPDVQGGFDIFVSRYADGAWSVPQPLQHVNSPADELSPTLSANNTLYFSSNRACDAARNDRQPDENAPRHPTTPLQEPNRSASSSFNLFHSTLRSTTPPQPIEVANSSSIEIAPSISPAGDFLYFASNRTAGYGGFDIYRLRLLIDGFGTVECLDDAINTSSDELDPYLGLGGFQLIYRSQTASRDQRLSAPQLLQATSREVFRDISIERGQIDWSALWRQIGPNLLWAAFALLLALLFLALIRDFRDRQISLLARCFAFSLFAHLLLMLAFNLLKVTTTIASSLGERGAIHVTLTSTANASEIGQQVRGDFVDTPSFEFNLPTESAPGLSPTPITMPEQVELTPTPATAQISDAQHQFGKIEVDLTNRQQTSTTLTNPESSASTVPPPSSTTTDISLEIQMPTAEPASAQSETVLERAIANTAQALATSASTAPRLEASDVPTPSMAHIEPASGTAIVDEQLGNSPSIDINALASPTDASSLEPRSAQPTLNMPASTFAAATDVSLPSATEPNASDDIETKPPEIRVAMAATDLAIPTLSTPVASDWQIIETHVPDQSAALRDDAHVNPAIEIDTTQDDLADSLPRGTAPLDLATAQDLNKLNISLPGAKILADRSPQLEESTATPIRLATDLSEINPLTLADLLRDLNDGVQLTEFAPHKTGDWVTENAKPTSASTTINQRPATATPIAPETAIADMPPVSIALDVQLPNAASDDREELRGIGRIVGRVVGAEDGHGMTNAQIRLTLPKDASVIVDTDDAGAYTLDVPPNVPEHFALSATAGGFIPESVSIPRRRVDRKTLTVNFALSRVTELVIALEDEPDVHHLGNDRFEGRINSQFQKRSEGRTFRASFNINRSQLPPNFARAEIVMLVKGVQCPHQVRINSRLVDDWLSSAPRDGSFGEYRASFSPDWLVEGKNRFKIRARSCSGDLDDFEFVNVRIRLVP